MKKRPGHTPSTPYERRSATFTKVTPKPEIGTGPNRHARRRIAVTWHSGNLSTYKFRRHKKVAQYRTPPWKKPAYLKIAEFIQKWVKDHG